MQRLYEFFLILIVGGFVYMIITNTNIGTESENIIEENDDTRNEDSNGLYLERVL